MSNLNIDFSRRIPPWLLRDYLGPFANRFSELFVTLANYHEFSRSLVLKGLIVVHVKNLLVEMKVATNLQNLIKSMWTINSLALELLFPLPHAIMTSLAEIGRFSDRIEANRGNRARNSWLLVSQSLYCVTLFMKAVKVSCSPHYEAASIIFKTFGDLLNRSVFLIPFDLVQIAVSCASLPRLSEAGFLEAFREISMEFGLVGQAFGREISKNPLFLILGAVFLFGAYSRASPKAAPHAPLPDQRESWAGVIGCEEAKQWVDQLILMVRNRQRAERLRVGIPTRILFHGAHGSGMELIAKIAAQRLGLPFVCASDANLNVRLSPPSVFLVKGIDRLSGDALENFYRQIAKIPPGIILFATAHSSPSESMRREFPESVLFALPTQEQRLAYFQQAAVTRPCVEGLDWTQAVDQTAMRSYADLASLIEFAARDACVRNLDRLDQQSIAFGLARLHALRASSHRLVVPRATLADVVGCRRAKERIQVVVEMLRNPVPYQALGAHISKGFLFYGAPGSGKTKIAEAMAHALGYRFLRVEGPELIKKYIGESGQAVHDLFQEAGECAPCVLFIDEIDAIARVRDSSSSSGSVENGRVVGAFLTAIEKVPQGVIVVGATNYPPDFLDPAFVRPGRLDERIEFFPPTDGERVEYFNYARTRHPCVDEIDWTDLVTRTAGRSYASLEALMNFAAINAAGRGLRALDRASIDAALASHS